LKAHFANIGKPGTGNFETRKDVFQTKQYFNKGFTITFSARIGTEDVPVTVVSSSFTIVDGDHAYAFFRLFFFFFFKLSLAWFRFCLFVVES
jgi:hypothetical protein